jgi:Spy/CpxP family protein refolding chaperone
MRRKYESLVVVLALSSSAWNVCLAQDAENPTNPVGQTSMRHPVTVLKSQTVRKELKLTDEQEQKVRAVLQKVRTDLQKVIERARERLKGLRTLPRNAAALKLVNDSSKAQREERSKILDAGDRDIMGILTNEQQVRLRQIQIWLDMDRALLNAEVIAELKLVSVQTDALTATCEKYHKKFMELPPSAFKGTAEEKRQMQERRATLRKESIEEYLAVLTDEQREQFDKMCGPKFEVDESEFRE